MNTKHQEKICLSPRGPVSIKIEKPQPSKLIGKREKKAPADA